jgi:hypothetical protein
MKAHTRKRFFKLPCRVRIFSDDDGHDYFVPVGREPEFEAWLAAGPYWENYKGVDCSAWSVGESLTGFTFGSPERV